MDNPKGQMMEGWYCEQMYRCKDCGVMIDQTRDGTKKTHVCGTRYCRQCRVTVEDNGRHLCYMRTPGQIDHEMLINRIDKFLGNTESANDVEADSESSQSARMRSLKILSKRHTLRSRKYVMKCSDS